MRYKSGVIIIAIIIFFGWGNNLYTQASENWTSSEMYLALRKLKVLGSVLYVAAHPDDENTRLISYFSKDRMVRTGYLSLTRGDGGQNLIGNEQGIELGLIRTQELLAAIGPFQAYTIITGVVQCQEPVLVQQLNLNARFR